MADREFEPKLDCRCMDSESLAHIRLSLLTSRDTYEDVASKLIKMGNIQKSSIDVQNLREQARKFDILLRAFDNVLPC